MSRQSPVLTALLLLAFAAAGIAAPPLTPQALSAALEAPEDERPQVLDVRTPEEFAAGRVPGAVLIPHDQLASRLDQLDKSRPVIVYCRSGRRSTLAETVLRGAGFDVTQLQGSWQAWQAAGLEAECDQGPCPPVADATR